MRISMERLLRGVIDFAGTFPPAALPVSASVERYVRAREGDEQWLLNRCACRSEDLAEFANQLGHYPCASYFPIAAIGRGGDNRPEWEEALAADAEAMNAFHRKVGELAGIEAYEVRLPRDGHPALYIRDLAGFRDADLFVELPLEEGFEDVLPCLAETEGLGAKARCGGDTGPPDAYQLAGFVRSCIDLELPIKLTAGLHHPLSVAEPRSYGFLNVLGAAALGLAEDLSRREIEQIILDPDSRSWRFENDGLAWRNRFADLAAIEESRNVLIAFGSCSIDDPLDGLQAFP